MVGTSGKSRFDVFHYRISVIEAIYVVGFTKLDKESSNVFSKKTIS